MPVYTGPAEILAHRAQVRDGLRPTPCPVKSAAAKTPAREHGPKRSPSPSPPPRGLVAHPVPYGTPFSTTLCRFTQAPRKSWPTGHRFANPLLRLHVTHIAGRNEHLAYGADTLPWGLARRQVSCAGSSNRLGRGADRGEAPIGERRLGGYRGTCAVFSAPAYARGCRLLVTVLCSAFSKPASSR